MGPIINSTYPRSASRFARAVLTEAFGPENYLEGFCKISALGEPNAFTIVRNPLEAVPSWVNAVVNHFDGFAGFTADNVVDESVPFYIEFMEKTVNRIGDIYVTTFEKFTENTESEIVRVSEHFDLPFSLVDVSSLGVDPRHVPGGNPDTPQGVEVLEHPRMGEAVAAYQAVLDKLT